MIIFYIFLLDTKTKQLAYLELFPLANLRRDAPVNMSIKSGDTSISISLE